MIASTPRTCALGLVAAFAATLSGCTGIEQSAKSGLSPAQIAAAPKASSILPPTPGTPGAVATAVLPPPEDPALAANAMVPIPRPVMLVAPAAPAAPGEQLPGIAQTTNVATAVATTEVASLTAMAELPDSLPSEVTAQHNMVPKPKPSTVLAYAAPSSSALSAVTSLAAVDNQYDISPPSAAPVLRATPDKATTGPTVINGLISKYAKIYEVPEALIHRVVHRESRYDPAAFNKGHFGLMQIKYATAKSMGYDGPASGLFDAETNLKYAIKYLRGAWMVADNSNDGAVRLYARGYYYDAKRKNMLHVLR